MNLWYYELDTFFAQKQQGRNLGILHNQGNWDGFVFDSRVPSRQEFYKLILLKPGQSLKNAAILPIPIPITCTNTHTFLARWVASLWGTNK
jgi:hypothetical protein